MMLVVIAEQSMEVIRATQLRSQAKAPPKPGYGSTE